MTRSPRVLVGALIAFAAVAHAATEREVAAEQYRRAEQLFEDLRAVPAAELGDRQYELVIDAFRKVHRITPASSYCDDALFLAAEVIEIKAQRFGSDALRDDAVSAYRYLIREYPHSKRLDEARARVERLQAGPQPKPEPEPAPIQVTEAPEPESEPAPPPEARVVPVKTAEAAAARTPAPLPNRAQASPARQGGGLAGIRDLRHWSRPDGTRIVLELDDFITYKFDFLERPRRLYFDLFTSRLEGALIRGASYEVGDAAVARIRVAQNRRSTVRLVADLLDEVSYDISWLANPPRLLIELRGKKPVVPSGPAVQIAEARGETAAGRVDTGGQSFEEAFAAISENPAPRTAPAPEPAAASLPPPKPADAASNGSQSLIRALGLKISRVVIDAGHGGHDPGTTGPNGLREKDVVLDIAMRLEKLIEAELGSEVILTRDSDRFVDLQERTRMANSSKADLFLSIHANASNTRSVRGVETFYLSLTADSWALKVASRENAASNRSVAELQDLLGKIAQKDNLDESRELAAKVQSSLYAGLERQSRGLRNRGVRKAPLLVLMGAKMPAILAEIGFLSNPSDEKLFQTSKHRQYVAEQIFEGVRQYADSLSAHQLTMKDAEDPRAQLD